METPRPSKVAALDLGDAAVSTYPRIYLDADIVVTPETVQDLCAALAGPGAPLVAVPSRHLELAGRPLVVRAYYAVQRHLPAFELGLFGRGLVALSREGRDRFGTFPEQVADDLFLDSLFTTDERVRLPGLTTSVETPLRVRDLLDRLTRVRRGNAALRARRPRRRRAAVRPSDRWSWLRDVVVPRPWLAPAGVVYAAVTLVAERRARRTAGSTTWGRDESSRRGGRVSTRVNLCFHGIGTPARELEPGEDAYWIGDRAFHEILDTVVGDPRVQLSFDDGNASDVLVALPALVERGLHATFFVLAGRLDQPGSLGRDDVRALAEAGMGIGSHGMDHVPWRHQDDATMHRELVEARERLAEVVGRSRRGGGAAAGPLRPPCARPRAPRGVRRRAHQRPLLVARRRVAAAALQRPQRRRRRDHPPRGALPRGHDAPGALRRRAHPQAPALTACSADRPRVRSRRSGGGGPTLADLLTQRSPPVDELAEPVVQADLAPRSRGRRGPRSRRPRGAPRR